MNDGTKLWDALDLLRRDGWCKGTAGLPDMPKCIIGAAMCAGADVHDQRALDEVACEQYTDRLNHERLRPAAAFNDHPDTTFEDVERVLEKAAIRRLEQEAAGAS